jgi:hypothetical protein
MWWSIIIDRLRSIDHVAISRRTEVAVPFPCRIGEGRLAWRTESCDGNPGDIWGLLTLMDWIPTYIFVVQELVLPLKRGHSSIWCSVLNVIKNAPR